jgi:hypothetical protein
MIKVKCRGEEHKTLVAQVMANYMNQSLNNY